MTSRGFAEVVTVIEAAYRIELTPEQHQVWFALLEPYADEIVKANVLKWCQTEHFPPTPADLTGMTITGRAERSVPGVEQTQELLARLESMRMLQDEKRERTKMAAPA